MASVLDLISNTVVDRPLQEVGIAGFTLWARVGDSFTLEAEVPTVPVESGAELSDHVILKPLTITIEGDVSDVHVRRNPLVVELLEKRAAIGNVTGLYAPPRTQSQLQAIDAAVSEALNAVAAIDALIGTGAGALRALGLLGSDDKSNQELFIDAMEAVHRSQQPISIDMPYRVRQDMIITTFTASTDSGADSTSFTLTAQQLRYFDTLTGEIRVPSEGIGGQSDAQANKGPQRGEEVEQSLWSGLIN